MNQYSIISNGITLKTYDDLVINLNYNIENIEDISKRVVNWSKTIALPGDPINNKFFKHIFDVNIDAITFNPNKKIAAIINSDDQTVFKGYLQLTEIFVNQGEVEYNINIFGELINVVNKMSDKLLSQLVDLSEYNHIRNQSNIVNSMDYRIVKNNTDLILSGPGEGYVYPDIVYGGSTNISNTKIIYEMFPAVYVKTIVDKLFDSLGYQIKSEFINSNYFKKLILPFTNDKLQVSEEVMTNKTTRVGIPYTTTPVPATTWFDHGQALTYFTNLTMFIRDTGEVDESGNELIFTDTLNQFNPVTSTYTNQIAGWYNVTFLGKMFAEYYHDDGNDMEYSAGSGPFRWNYVLYVTRTNGDVIPLVSSVPLTFTPSSGSHTSPWFDAATSLDIDAVASNVWLAPGDKLNVTYALSYPSDVHWVGILNDDKIHARLVFEDFSADQFSKFLIEPVSNVSMGNELIEMNQVLPANIKAVDFMSALVKMFNLIIIEDNTDPNIIIIEPKDDYYSSSQKVLEWDDILDYNSDYKITPMSEIDVNEYLFTYTDDDDYLNKNYTEETKKIYGEFKVTVENDFSNKSDKTEILFAPTPDGKEFIDDRVAPYFVDRVENDFKQKKVKPRILFYGGTIDCNPVTIKDSINGVAPTTTITKSPYCGMWDNPTAPMYDLGFGRTDKIYWNSNVFPTQTLFEKFHKATINNLINPNSRLFEGKFKLTPRDIADFDFRNIIFLLGSYWRVIEIKDYNPVASDQLTLVTLVKITDIDVLAPLTVQIPTSNRSCPTDVITTRIGKRFVHQSESGQPITEDCCKSLGGNFVDGTCYIGEISLHPIDFVATSVGSTPVTSDGPLSPKSNENTINSPGVNIIGTGNFIGTNVQSSLLIGNNSTIESGLENVILIGDNVTATESNTLGVTNINTTTINNVPATSLTTGLPGVLSIDNTTGGNDIVVSVGDKITSPTTKPLNLYSDNKIINTVDDVVGTITDTLSIDPQGLGNGTGILSQNTTTLEVSAVTVTPTLITIDSPNINIPTLPVGTPINNVGIDAGGNLVVGTGSGTDTNFANTDLTFTADRFHDADGFQLNIENTPHFHITSPTGLACRMIIDALNATDPKILSFRTNNSQRFAVRVDGANDDIAFRCYDNTGTFTIAPIKIERATGQVEISEAYTLPLVDGTANQVLKTDGAGNTSWTTVSAPLETIATVTGTCSITNDITLVNNSASITVTLPTAVGIAGKKYTIKAKNNTTASNNITIATTASQTIDTVTTYVMRIPFESVTVVSDGTAWWII